MGGCIGLGVMRVQASRCREELGGGAPKCSTGAGGCWRIKLAVKLLSNRMRKEKKKEEQKNHFLRL